jgi:predicted ABC-type ATPase
VGDTPFLLMVAGPDGSGKSTLTDDLIAAGLDLGEYISPDQIAATLDMPQPARSKQAQAIADFQRESCLTGQLSFSFKTVMSHQSKVDFLVRADDAGYDVTLCFVCTSDPEINVRRVESRVRRGGHDVPHDRIVARYWRSLGWLAHAALVARRTLLFDNSALLGYSANALLPNPKTGLRPVGELIRDGNNYEITLEAEVPAWVFEHLVMPLDELARHSDGEITLIIHQRPGPLG